MVGKNSSDLPPGFRFHPTDEELIMYYLRNQSTSRPCPVSIIPEIDIYKFDPWELPEKAGFGENEWYFFSPRDRKYPNGARPNRAAVSGYWKATGTDKSIHSGSKYVGVKKALVFYQGKPPKGVKTDWIMHEYRLMSDSTRQITRQNGSMRLDDWVLCRIYKKKSMARIEEQRAEELSAQTEPTYIDSTMDSQALKFPRICSISNLWQLDCLGSLPQLLNDNSYTSGFSNYQNMADINSENGPSGIPKFQLGEMPFQYMDSSVKLEANHKQPIFVNPMFQFE